MKEFVIAAGATIYAVCTIALPVLVSLVCIKYLCS